MKIEGIALATLVALTGCPKGDAPKRGSHDCNDVEDHAMKLHTEDARSRGTEEANAMKVGQMEGLNTKAVCLDTWTSEHIECYVAAATLDLTRACVP